MTTDKSNLNLRKGFENCFGCGTENPIGLRLKVAWDGEKALAEFTPGLYHTGIENVVHGGVLAALMDEVMSYVPFSQGLLTVTARIEARFRRSARPGQPLLISAFMTKSRSKIMDIKCLVTLKDGTVVAEGKSVMWVVGREVKS